MGDVYKIKVLYKAFNLFEIFNDNYYELSAIEIENSLSLNKTNFHLIKNLQELGYSENNLETQRYRLGVKPVYLASFVKSYLTLKKVSRPLLLDLNRRTKETVRLAMSHQGQSLYLEKIEGSQVIRVATDTGSRLPAHCTGVGKVLLSSLSFDEIEKIAIHCGVEKFTANTIDNLETLNKELGRVRLTGVAIDREETEQGLICIAALIYCRGSIIAAISLSMPKNRFKSQRAYFFFEIKKVSKKISELLDSTNLRGLVSSS